MVSLHDWGKDEDEDCGNRMVCDEVGLFSDNVNGCRKEKMFGDLFCMRRGLH